MHRVHQDQAENAEHCIELLFSGTELPDVGVGRDSCAHCFYAPGAGLCMLRMIWGGGSCTDSCSICCFALLL